MNILQLYCFEYTENQILLMHFSLFFSKNLMKWLDILFNICNGFLLNAYIFIRLHYTHYITFIFIKWIKLICLNICQLTSKTGIVSASPNQIKKFYLGLCPKKCCKIPSASTSDYYRKHTSCFKCFKNTFIHRNWGIYFKK